MAAKKTAKARQTKPTGGTKAPKAATSRSSPRKTKRVTAAAGYSRARTRELSPTQLGDLTGQFESVPPPEAGGPLSGVTVPGVDLKRGSQGPAVKQLQGALVKLGVMTQAQMNTGPGIFGPITESSLKKFQKAHGVDAIGVYGPKTRAAFVKLGAKLGSAPKPPPSGHKNPFLAQFQRALAQLRLPESWATSEALWQLVQHESSWNPRAKNPSSTAFGLFQFLKSTWATYCKEGPYGSTDPYVQALGGFRYIKSRYRTPEGAWAFWQSHHWY